MLIVVQELVQLYAFTMIIILVYWDLTNLATYNQRDKVGRYFGAANWVFFGIFAIGILKSIFDAIKIKMEERKKASQI